jgi:hypothetical protein
MVLEKLDELVELVETHNGVGRWRVESNRRFLGERASICSRALGRGCVDPKRPHTSARSDGTVVDGQSRSVWFPGHEYHQILLVI